MELAVRRVALVRFAVALFAVLAAAALGPASAGAVSPDDVAVEADDTDTDDAGRSRGAMRIVLRIAETLHLSDEQTIRVAAEFRRVAQRRRELGARKAALVGTLESQLGRKPLDDAALTSLTQQLAGLEHDVAVLRQDLWKSIQPVLTPEQGARFVLLRGELERKIDGERKRRRKSRTGERRKRD